MALLTYPTPYKYKSLTKFTGATFGVPFFNFDFELLNGINLS